MASVAVFGRRHVILFARRQDVGKLAEHREHIQADVFVALVIAARRDIDVEIFRAVFTEAADPE